MPPITGGFVGSPEFDPDCGSFYDHENTDAFAIDTQSQAHCYHSNGIAANLLDGWTFDAGGAGTPIAISSIADGADSGVDIEVTTGAAHGLAVGDIISQTGLADAAYVGVFVVKAIISTTQYEVAAVYTATGTGTMNQAATLTCGAGSAGRYKVELHASATSQVNNESFDYHLMQNATVIPGGEVRRKFGVSADYGSFSIGTLANVSVGDKISLALQNESGVGDVTIRYLSLLVTRA